MQPAFVPASVQRPVLTKSFSGTAVATNAPTPASERSVRVPSAQWSLDDYAKYNDDLKPAPAVAPSKPSGVWTSFLDGVKEDSFNPFEGAAGKAAAPVSKDAALAMTPYGRILLAAAAAKFGKGGDPDTDLHTAVGRGADRYMAACVTRQYKQTAAPFGEYGVQCTEGAARHQAEEARSAALSAQFRLRQRSSAQKFGDFCETRRQAVVGAHGCSYEETLLARFPVAARAFVTGGSEARGNCVRYAVGASPAETYMAAAVDKQMKMRAVPRGVYDVLCSDGNARNVAEYKRVAALAARFRAGQMPAAAKEQAKFSNAKYARDFYAHGCSYEETLFNKYPAVSASMRPSTARY